MRVIAILLCVASAVLSFFSTKIFHIGSYRLLFAPILFGVLVAFSSCVTTASYENIPAGRRFDLDIEAEKTETDLPVNTGLQGGFGSINQTSEPFFLPPMLYGNA